ncbi:MAG: HAD hydrolase-like protein [Cyanobium sp.]
MSLRRVVKVGTSLLRGDEVRSTAAVISDLAVSLAAARSRGESIVLVTSGAVARELGVPFTTSAAKPRRQALRRVLDDLQLPPERVALIGDRVFTDVIAGNRLGLFTILVKPIDPQGLPCQRDHLQKLEVRLANWMGGSLS